MTKTFDVAVVGVTSLVGEAIVELLAEREFPLGAFYPLADEQSAGNSIGNKVEFGGKYHTVRDVAEFDFAQVQIALFCAGSAVAEQHATRAARTGCMVIDASPCFRADDEVPLVIPEVNPEAIVRIAQRNIVASPDSATVQLLVAVKPIYDAVGIERINVVSYQAVSAYDKAGVEELASQTIALLNMQDVKHQVFPRQLAFNVLPQIDTLEDNGYTRDEMKMLHESQKILADEAMFINATIVQAPVFFGHSQAVHLETGTKLAAQEARKLLRRAPGVKVVDEAKPGGYPTAVTDAAGQNEVFVGRIRDDISHPQGLDLWIVADNVRKGAALNVVQLAELLVKDVL
jgi:aspartate-semialdehyde dehydrogenase